MFDMFDMFLTCLTCLKFLFTVLIGSKKNNNNKKQIQGLLGQIDHYKKTNRMKIDDLFIGKKKRTFDFINSKCLNL